jgi:hypothetical protein
MRYRPNDDEAAVAFTIAKRRNQLNGGGSNLPGGERATIGERLLQHYAAALSEIATSRMTGLCWTGCGKGAEGLRDVGDLIEVRSVRSPELGLLVRRPKPGKLEDIGVPYVLIHVGEDRWCAPLGWEYWDVVLDMGRVQGERTDHPCWILEPERLRPFDELLDLIPTLILRRLKSGVEW